MCWGSPDTTWGEQTRHSLCFVFIWAETHTADLFLLQQEVLRVVDVIIHGIFHPQPPGLTHWSMDLNHTKNSVELQSFQGTNTYFSSLINPGSPCKAQRNCTNPKSYKSHWVQLVWKPLISLSFAKDVFVFYVWKMASVCTSVCLHASLATSVHSWNMCRCHVEV